MSDTNINNVSAEPERRGFPFITALAAVATLFVFLGLMVLAYRSPNYLDDTKTEPKADPAAKLDEVKARNEAALKGVGAKMSLDEAHGKLSSGLKGPNDKLPFPIPEPSTTKDDKGKKP